MDLIISFLTEWGYLALFLTITLENMNIPIPSEIILGFAGFLVAQGIFSYWPAILTGTIGGLTGSLLSYWLGSSGGRRILLKYGRYMYLSEKKLIAADSLFNLYGGMAVFTGRILPGVRTFISLPAGIARYPLPRFIFFTILGTVPWTMFLVYAGYLLGDNWQMLLAYDKEIFLACFLLAAMIAGIYILYRRQNGRKKNH